MILKCGNHTGKNLGEKWKENIAGYFLLLDYTDTAMLKPSLGQPWFLSKAQDNFLVLSDNVISPEVIDDHHKVELELKLNGITK